MLIRRLAPARLSLDHSSAKTDALAFRLLRNIGNNQPFAGAIALPHAYVRTGWRRRALEVIGPVAVTEVGGIGAAHRPRHRRHAGSIRFQPRANRTTPD
jgi:hypothetical protein